MREYALNETRKAVARGWSFTQLRGKHPVRKGWQRAPFPSIDVVEGWLATGNVGLRTGKASGLIVLDDDTDDGSACGSLDLPLTVTAMTGSGKRHFYFAAPEEKVGNATGNLPDKVDVRGEGGQVAFVGSTHPETGGVYRWVEGRSPDDLELATLPDSVMDLIRTRKKRKRTAAPRKKSRPPVALEQRAHQALEEAASAVASAPGGRRNDTLNNEAFRMARWVGAGQLTREQVEQALSEAARSAGLEDAEIEATIRSGLDGGTSERPSIVLRGGELPDIVEQAEAALMDARFSIYQRGTLLVRPMRAPAMTLREVYRRAEGVLMLQAVDGPYLVDAFTRSASWLRPSMIGDLIVVDCPERIARTYLSRSGHWRLRTLLGVIEAPTLRPDGSILDLPGYDTSTCLLFEPGHTNYPDIPRDPSMDSARQALGQLKGLIVDFPWLEPSDRSAALAAILTALIRPSIRTAPLFAFRAPKMASGKSLLADVVALIATGRVASVMSQGKDEDEDKKRMLAILVEGIGVASIDNIEREFGGAALCSVLTAEVWRERILGKTGTATVPTNTTWLATGNNIRFVGDIVTRVVPCDLDPKVERPEERVFDVDLHDYVPKHRSELVVAGLTVLRAYHVAGRPHQGLPVFGRFEGWSNWVRSALVWLGEPDPCAGRSRLQHYDPVGSQLRAVLLAWHESIGDTTVTAAEAVRIAEGEGRALYEAIQAVATGSSGKPDPRRLGRYLEKYERRTEAGLRVERIGERQGSALWRVSPTDSVGFVGDVGSFQPVADRGVTANTFEGLPDQKKTGNESNRAPAEKIPRNPRNPPNGDSTPVLGAENAVPDPSHSDLRSDEAGTSATGSSPPEIAPLDGVQDPAPDEPGGHP